MSFTTSIGLLIMAIPIGFGLIALISYLIRYLVLPLTKRFKVDDTSTEGLVILLTTAAVGAVVALVGLFI